MTDWFRSWHGAPTDTKWLGIAKRAGVMPGIVVAVAWALMDRASQASDRGNIAGYDADGLAYFYGCEPEQVDAIVAAMRDKGMVVADRITSWEKRQPKREDDSSQRVREHRERTKADAERDVTQRNAPETDTELDTEAEKQKVAPKGALSIPGFDEFWSVYPEKVGKGAARKAFPAALSKASLETLIAGVRRYIATKPADRSYCNPATWLNEERWDDQPAAPPARGSPAQAAPSMSQLLQVIRDHPNENQPEPPEDRSSFRQAIPYLRTAGSG